MTTRLCAPREELSALFAPVLKQAMRDVGYYATLDKLVGEYNAIPVLEDMAPFDVEPEMRQRALDAICLRIARQESRLRRMPEERLPADTPDGSLLRVLFAFPF